MKLDDAIDIAALYLDIPEARLIKEPAIFTSLVKCGNLIYRDIATDYMPLIHTEKIKTADGKINYASFSKTPLRVLSVKAGGVKAGFKAYPGYILLDNSGEAEITYSFFPPEKAAQEELEAMAGITPQMIAQGIAAEYCLITGLYEKSVLYQERFKESLRALTADAVARKIPERRWI
jgi:hypothetical protein